MKTAIITASAGWFTLTKFTVRKQEAMAATPVANPSMLSSKLIALVMPISQKIVITMLTGSERVHGKANP